MTRTLCHDKHRQGAPMLISAHISQVASSTPFLCCSQFSPIAFNLSNTKSSIQLLHVPDCPFRRPNLVRSYPTRSFSQKRNWFQFYIPISEFVLQFQFSFLF